MTADPDRFSTLAFYFLLSSELRTRCRNLDIDFYVTRFWILQLDCPTFMVLYTKYNLKYDIITPEISFDSQCVGFLLRRYEGLQTVINIAYSFFSY